MTLLRRNLTAAVALAGLAAFAAPRLAAQNWRTLSAQRQRATIAGDADTLHVRVDFGAGRLALAAAQPAQLYDLSLRYDGDALRPTHQYDPATHTLRMSAGNTGNMRLFSFRSHDTELEDDHSDHGSRLSLDLARDLPLDVDLDVAATDARLDLSGLAVSALRVKAAASGADITFGTANPASLAELDLDASAAGLSVHQLGNAHARTVRLATRVGGADLDFSGDWTGDVVLHLDLVLAGATLHVPRDVGIEVQHLSKVLGGMDAPSLTEKNGSWSSANLTRAKRRLIIDGSVTLAGLEIVPID